MSPFVSPGLDPNQENELDNLQREGELPLEELMRLYNCPPPSSGLDRMKPRKPRKKRKRIPTLVNNNTEATPAEEEQQEQDKPNDCKSARLSDEDVDVVPVPDPAQDSSTVESTAATGGNSLEDDVAAVAVIDGGDEDEDGDYELPVLGSTVDELSTDDEEEGLQGPSELVQLLDDVQDNDEEEEADYDYYPDEADLKKSILVGENHQAFIPSQREQIEPTTDSSDQLLWTPHTDKVKDDAVEQFLVSFYRLRRHLNHPEEQPGLSVEQLISGDIEEPPITAVRGSVVVKDEEGALKKLLEADYNVETALQQVCNLMQTNGGVANPSVAPVPSSYCSTTPVVTWTEEECRNFELGIRLYGKNFTLIQSTKVPSRTVQDLVQFYYIWKKTARYDSFDAKQRMEKKRHSSMSNQNPGLTAFMDRFLEEHQQRSISPRQSSAASVASSTPPPAGSVASMGTVGNEHEGETNHNQQEEGISDGNHSLLIYADSKRHRTSGGPTTPPVSDNASCRHPLEFAKAVGKEAVAEGQVADAPSA